jgi:tRNA pseudouridine55 synthase
VVVSKGTSVRVLVDDIGKVLGCGAHVTSLRRDSIGGFSVETAWTLEVLLPLAKKYAKGFRNAQS